MSNLETRVTQLIDEIQALKQAYEGKADEIDQRLAATLDTFQDTIDDLDAGTIYLDQAAGDDANDGASNRPVASLGRAVALIPRHGSGTVRFLGDHELRENVLIDDRAVVCDLDDHRMTQGTAPGSGAFSIQLQGRMPSLFFKDGDVATAVFDNNVASAGQDNAFIARLDRSAPDVSLLRCRIELGDTWFMSVGQTANGLANLSYGHGAITINPAATATPRLVQLKQATMAFSWATASSPSDLSLGDLFGGVVRAADGEPRNVLSNVAI